MTRNRLRNQVSLQFVAILPQTPKDMDFRTNHCARQENSLCARVQGYSEQQSKTITTKQNRKGPTNRKAALDSGSQRSSSGLKLNPSHLLHLLADQGPSSKNSIFKKSHPSAQPRYPSPPCSQFHSWSTSHTGISANPPHSTHQALQRPFLSDDCHNLLKAGLYYHFSFTDNETIQFVS